MWCNKYIIAIIMWFSLSVSACSPNPKKDYLVTITTSFGEIKLVLFEDTPLHRENFLKLAKAGRYDSTSFHRVINEFMIQAGDVNTKEGTMPSFAAMVEAEISSRHLHRKGAVAAANNGNPQKKSSECQFYIVQGKTFSEEELTLDRMKLNQYFGQLLSLPDYQELREEMIELQRAQDLEGIEAKMKEIKPLIEQQFDISLQKEISPEQRQVYTTIGGAPHLDGGYTVFGQVVAGMEVVDAIASQSTDAADKPVQDIFITVTVEEIRKSKITKLYGFEYAQEK